ncbi:MAG: GTPase ObgE [Ruminococcaceae bacterium]|nr:GTPase ObgE [Oscillospiraceae bacterium]
MFVDNIKIYVKAGNGGNGAISFHREKYVSAGGPDGGDGGRGGNVVFRVDEGANTLLAFRYKRKFVAEPGGDGKTGKMHGKNGADVVVTVPRGTLIKDPETKKIIIDMACADEYILCKGGRGGWGNRHFATPTRQIPRFAKNGTKGEEREVILELKMLAEVGLIGFPNVGKSSILSRISAAKPKIANYHFTTLSPNLGVVPVREGKGFLAADIPGLIEGASDGAGLGHAFLRHVDRCRLLLHVVDISAQDGRCPCDDIDKIDEELRRYSPELSTRPQIVVANKIDSVDPESDIFEKFKEKCSKLSREIVCVSAVTGEGLDELVSVTAKRLADLPPMTVYESEITAEDEAIRNASGEKTTVVRRENKKYIVEGEWLYNFMGQINFDDYESLNFFQRVLMKNGVIDKLREAGVEEGDTVSIYDFEFDFVY